MQTSCCVRANGPRVFRPRVRVAHIYIMERRGGEEEKNSSPAAAAAEWPESAPFSNYRRYILSGVGADPTRETPEKSSPARLDHDDDDDPLATHSQISLKASETRTQLLNMKAFFARAPVYENATKLLSQEDNTFVQRHERPKSRGIISFEASCAARLIIFRNYVTCSHELMSWLIQRYEKVINKASTSSKDRSQRQTCSRK